MKKKLIKIFLASSIDELKETRNELARFVLGLNNRLISQEIYIQMELCEEMDNAVPYVRKQDEYNAFIKNADFVFFVFYDKVGGYTREELDTAFKEFKKTGSPRIFTYFYDKPKNELTIQVKEMMEKLDKELHHFYSLYGNIDMIKLAILLQITMFFDKLVILENNEVFLDQHQCMSLANIPTFSNNEDLIQKKKELNLLEKKYKDVINLFEKDDTNEELASRVSIYAERINLLEKEIQNIKQNTWKYVVDMQRKLWEGNISEIQKEAYRCLEKGDIKGASAYLNEMSKDIKTLVATSKKNIQDLIDCYSQKIYIIKMQDETEQNLQEIKECYDAIYDWAKSGEFYACEFILEYAIFLTEQNDAAAEQIYDKLYWIYSDPSREVSDREYFDWYYYVAMFNKNQGRTEHVEEYYQKCIKLLDKIEKDSDLKMKKKASILLEIGNYYKLIEAWDKAEKKYQEFFEFIDPQKEYLESYEEDYIRDISIAYGSLAVLEMQRNGKDKEEIRKNLDNSLSWMFPLYSKNKYKYADDISGIYLSYATFCGRLTDKENQQLAKDFYEKSIKICEEMYKRNPYRYGERLMQVKNNFGGYCERNGQLEKAEEYLSESNDLAMQLLNYNTEKYNNMDNLIVCLNYGETLKAKGDPKAIEYFEKCLDIIESYNEEKKRKYQDMRARIYHSMAFCEHLGIEDRVDMMRKSILITEEKYLAYPDKYRKNLVLGYHDIGILYYKISETYELAKRFLYKTDTLLQEKAVEINLEEDGLQFAQIFNNLALILYSPDNYMFSVSYIKRGIKILNDLDRIDTKKYRPFLVEFYDNLAACYYPISNKKVITCYIKALDLAKDLKKIDDDIYSVISADIYSVLLPFCISTNYTFNLDISYCIRKYEEVLSKLNVETYKEHLIKGYYVIGNLFEYQGDNIKMKQYYKKCWNILKDIDDEIIQDNFADIFNDLTIKNQEWKGTRKDERVVEREEERKKTSIIDKLWKRRN